VAEPAPTTAFAPETTVRVDLEKISHLLDLAASLAVARAELRRALLPIVPRVDDRAALREVQRAMAGLDAISGALSRAALATRLVPVDFLALRLSRAVKQLAKSLGKEAELFIFGAETELDKVLADQLADPLMHMVRNALDHGIELPEEREAKGKPRAGRLELRAETRGRDVLLALSDDGRGVDAERVLARARERGLVAEGENRRRRRSCFSRASRRPTRSRRSRAAAWGSTSCARHSRARRNGRSLVRRAPARRSPSPFP
jgi:two-component system chemotaxis sensor kinase CheA